MALLTLWLLAGFVAAPFIGPAIARADRRLQASQGAGQASAVDVNQFHGALNAAGSENNRG